MSRRRRRTDRLAGILAGEPLLTRAVVAAAIAVAVAWGLDLTEVQQAALTAAATLAVALWSRSKVTPVARVERDGGRWNKALQEWSWGGERRPR